MFYYNDFEKRQALLKNEDLIENLELYRKNMLGLGTNKIKRRLNKLSKTDNIAKAIRLALEIEDKNILAKKYSGNYKQHYYESKYSLILELVKVFNENGWNYGKEESDVNDTDYIIYFEIPGCSQISWHTSFNKPAEIPNYNKKWDGISRTLEKLAGMIKEKYEEIIF